MTEGGTKTNRWRLPPLGLWMAFLISYVLCAVTMAAMMACRFSLAEPMWERLLFSILWGLLFSLLPLVIFAAPLFTVLFFIGERWPSSRRLLA